MWAYAEELPRLAARRQIDAADVALQTRMAAQSREGAESFRQWLMTLTRQAQHVIQAAEAITFNGVVVGVNGLARRLKRVFGSGVERD